MKNPFLKTSNILLKKVSEEVPESKIGSLEIKRIIERMLSIANGERNDRKRPVMVGLAASQIGISRAVILVAVGATVRKTGNRRKIGKLKTYINPKIIWSSETKEEWYEGCYSIPGVYGIVFRPLSIRIEALDINGKKVLEKHTGFTARIFLHEIDHLNGKFFINHIKNPMHLHRVKPSEFSLYRNKEAWKNWPKKYPLPLAYELQKQV